MVEGAPKPRSVDELEPVEVLNVPDGTQVNLVKLNRQTGEREIMVGHMGGKILMVQKGKPGYFFKEGNPVLGKVAELPGQPPYTSATGTIVGFEARGTIYYVHTHNSTYRVDRDHETLPLPATATGNLVKVDPLTRSPIAMDKPMRGVLFHVKVGAPGKLLVGADGHHTISKIARIEQRGSEYFIHTARSVYRVDVDAASVPADTVYPSASKMVQPVRPASPEAPKAAKPVPEAPNPFAGFSPVRETLRRALERDRRDKKDD